MMYLTQAIRDFEANGTRWSGCFLPKRSCKKPGLTLGYRTVELSQTCILGVSGIIARGHEFHYSTLDPTRAT